MPVKKKPSAPVDKVKPAGEVGELTLIRKLAEILNETGLTEIELDRKGARVRVAKSVQTTTMMAAAPLQHHAPAPGVQNVASPIASPVKTEIA